MTIYLEEEVTKHVEFPSDGKFTTIGFGRYRICGDASVDEHPTISDEPRSFSKWAVTRPWAAPSSLSSVIAGIRNKRGAGSGTQPYETFLKRSIPYVSLCLDESGRNVLVDSTINNVYVKVPDKSLSASTILSAMATKIGCVAEELVILDVKFLEVTDDKGENHCRHNVSFNNACTPSHMYEYFT